MARRKRVAHSMGDRHTVAGIECEVRFMNAGVGFLFPVKDGPEWTLIARHICYGKVDEYGKVTKL